MTLSWLGAALACLIVAGVTGTVLAPGFATAPARKSRAAEGGQRIAASVALPGILLSRQLMERRGLRVGDTVRLAANAAGEGARDFRIAGVYEPTPDPMRFAQPRLEARLHLPDLLALAADRLRPGPLAPREGLQRGSPPADAITAINVDLTDEADAGAFSRDAASRLPGLVARPTRAPDIRTGTFVVIERFHLAIAIVTVVGAAMFLLALMVMLVDERRPTVGILRLIGFTRARILRQVLVEGALIAVAGALGGILFALLTQGVFNRFFQWRYDTTLTFLRITPAVVWQALLLAVPLGIAASVLASWTLLRRGLLALIRR